MSAHWQDEQRYWEDLALELTFYGATCVGDLPGPVYEYYLAAGRALGLVAEDEPLS